MSLIVNVIVMFIFYLVSCIKTIFNIFRQIVPATLKRQPRQDPRGPRTAPGGRPEGGRSGEDRSQYRRAPGAPGTDKKAEVGAGTAELDFVSIILHLYSYNLNILLF